MSGWFVCDRDYPLLTDLYQLTMANIYFQKNLNDMAAFDFFVRPNPKRGYYVMAGVAELVDLLENFRFDEEELAFLQSLGKFSEEFLEYLRLFRFGGEVWAIKEGEIFFANEPVVSVRASLIEAQIIETLLINILQLPILVATKAARCFSVARGTSLVDFGLRRAQGKDAGMQAARSSYLAGFLGTSNVLAAKEFGIPAFGTMAHSFVQVHTDEREAFADFIDIYPENAILLVDTYDTIEGVKRAIEAVKGEGLKKFKGIRIDSGDLLSLSKKAREMLDVAGFTDAMIIASGGIDEYEIEKLLQEDAPIDAWGVGTKLVTSADMPYLDCAYKLVEYANEPKMKFSPHKVTLPGRKQVFRWYKEEKIEDIVDLFDASYTDAKPLLQLVMQEGKAVGELPSLQESREYFMQNFQKLPENVKDIHNPTTYEPTISPNIQNLIKRLKSS